MCSICARSTGAGKVRDGPISAGRTGRAPPFTPEAAQAGEGAPIIDQKDANRGGDIAPVLSLLFDAAARPDARAVHALAAAGGTFAVSHDPRDTSGGDWLELLIHGLTFDLHGLAPGEPSTGSLHPNRFGLLPSLLHLEAVTLVPGPHLAASGDIPVVQRTQLLLGVQLCDLPGLGAVGWGQAGSLSGVEHFRRTALAWLEGGEAPAFLGVPA